MSAFEIVNRPVAEVAEFLAPHKAKLRQTKFPDVYLIQFDGNTNSTHPDVNQLKGLIYNAVTHQIYSMTYPVPVEFKDQSQEVKSEILAGLTVDNYSVQEAFDGTLLRLWYYDEGNCWVLSTNGVEDAQEAFWMNNVSFASQFWSAMQAEQEKFENLNKDHVYLFLLCHPLNIIVVNHDEAKVYHMATYDRTTQTEVEDTLNLSRPATVKMTVEEVQQKVQESEGTPVASAGYMVVKKDGNVTRRYRFENRNYTEARELRGDTNNVNFLVLGHMLNKDRSKLEKFLLYYPVYIPYYTQLYQRLTSLTGLLFQQYGLRYKLRRDIFVHPRHHQFLSEIHTQVFLGKLKGMGKTIQAQDIWEFILSQPTAKVLYLLNYILDQ